MLRLFGAKIAHNADVRSSVKIWWPGNLVMENNSTLGPHVICYNMAPVRINRGAMISQRSELCTGSHDIDDPSFSLNIKPIEIGAKAWVASNSFVGPGVIIGEGAVLGACSVACSNLESWSVYIGNPAQKIRQRKKFDVTD